MATSSSRRWLQRQAKDPYVKAAKKQGLRSRAYFKLAELQERDRLFRPGQWVLDLGAAPGGWCQMATQWIQPSGHVIAVDLLPMASIAGVTVIQGDFQDAETVERIRVALGDRKVAVVMSDIAPNITGIRAVDQPRSIRLAELAWEMAQEVLAPEGCFLIKVFQGEGFDDYVRDLRKSFDKVVIRKPPASRSESREHYILGKGYGCKVGA